MKKRIALIRHGETDWNSEGKIQGQVDIELNEAGRRQAQALAVRLKDQRWDLLISSDLSRAMDTAKAIGRLNPMPFRTDARLRERSFGEIEGTTLDERLRRWGENWRSLDHGGESDRQLSIRALDIWHELASDAKHENILVVTHGGFIYHLLHDLLPGHSFPPPIQNTSLSLLQRVEDRWVCDPYNSATHLNPDFISQSTNIFQ